jgi:hypothetical protein
LPPGSPLRLISQSWGVHDDFEQTPDEFLSSVRAAVAKCGLGDLILAAGLTVARRPPAQSVLTASSGTPVLFEVDSGHGNRTWWLAHGHGESPQNTLVRRRQLAVRFDDCEGFSRVATVIAHSADVIEFEGVDLRLILFICGENNALDYNASRTVFKRLPDSAADAERLQAVMGGPWAMLNPAHARYYPQALPTGFGKVGVVRINEDRTAGPTLRWLAQRTTEYGDGTTSPIAVIHVNNYDPQHPETEEFAAVRFGDTEERVRRVVGPVGGTVPIAAAETRPWRASVFEIIEAVG